MIKLRTITMLGTCVGMLSLGCSGGGEDYAAEETDGAPLEEMIPAAGDPDIRHGTDQYESPVPGLDPSVEQRLFVAFLSGGQEVPAVRTKALGAMAFVLNPAGTKLKYLLVHNVEGATDAHLHTGAPGENGAIAVPLPSAETHHIGSLPMTKELVAALLAGRLYANVHSPTSPKGEIRGQILRPGETLFTAALSGAEEVPRVSSSASGFASLVLNAARNKITYRITVNGVTPTDAHVHRGIVGVNGNIVYPLSPLGQVIEGTQAITSKDLEDLGRRQWYVNVHSATNPKGEIRGQVARPGEAYFGANLTSAQEVLPSTSTSTNTGNAMIVMGMARSKFLYSLTTNATPTLAHIHRGPGGTNGDVELDLPNPAQSMVGVEDLGEDRAQDIQRGLFYFNVHTAENSKGEIRGQVLSPGETLYTAVLSGANEVPSVDTSASGGVGVILNANRTEIRYDGSATDISPTNAHIHAGVAGVNGPIAFPLMFQRATVSGNQSVTSADVQTLDEAGFYVNLHSAQNPTGEIRGQLKKQ
ncbi:CHRD domain-containing protein [Sorangium sp. So ce861]|uniref:CHRD domain-containing protein n=1 Tax=Sorangium sp. So ce861 TaxID=3133323 RepID=UPI003F612ED3